MCFDKYFMRTSGVFNNYLISFYFYYIGRIPFKDWHEESTFKF